MWHREALPNAYPWNLGAVEGFHCLGLDHPITFFVGDNGSGKSTLLEAIALAPWPLALMRRAGSRNHRFAAASTESALDRAMRPVWSTKDRPRLPFSCGKFLSVRHLFGAVGRTTVKLFQSGVRTLRRKISPRTVARLAVFVL